MYAKTQLGAVGETRSGGPEYEPKPAGNQCFHAWYFPIQWYKPDRPLMGEGDMYGYTLLGWMCTMHVTVSRQGVPRTHPTPDRAFLTAVVGTWEYQSTVEIIPEGQPNAGLERRIVRKIPSPASKALLAHFLQGPASGGVLTVCGPTFTGPDGNGYVVVEEWQKGPDPASTFLPIIEVTGTLTEWSPPGISQVWPKVGNRVVSSSAGEPGSISFGAAWNKGEIPLGSTIYMKGKEDLVRSAPGIIPQEWRVVERGDGPGAGGDKPGVVDLPDAPPTPREPTEPDPDDTEPDPLDPFGDDDQEDQPDNGIPPGEGQPPPGGGTTPGGPGPGNGTAPGGTPVAEAGFGIPPAAIVLGLVLLPFFFGKERK